ncbi:hypothetical protein BGZ65_008307 [Modicella reniformis]|uniref:Beta-lactamase-related domain-containing protein n=1 Tax=Modicella reniformis TaxID=1440133 RepID=A0A9P6SS42_9FUNG|nr:hypothetical protein BGZ65_008307 [Modicella reniformis]
MPIASVTKGFTATAIGELVAEGKMDWDSTPVIKYLPEFELQDLHLSEHLTMADLLSHRTGFPSFDLAWFRNTESRRDLIKRMRHVKMKPKLSSDCQYNNIMYAVAGEAAANVAGVSYEELVHTKVLKPLGLSNTGFSPSEMRERSSNYAMPYRAASFEDAQKGKVMQGYLDEIYAADAPAGDRYSNVFDLVRWGHAIMQSGMLDGKQILNKDSVEETKSGHTFMRKELEGPEFFPTVAYGFGWIINTYKGQLVYRHDGSNPGYRTNLTLFPEAELVIAHFANLERGDFIIDAPWYIADELLGLPKTRDWINDVSVKRCKARYNKDAKDAIGSLPALLQDKPPMHPLQEFVGHYTDPFWGDVSVLMRKEKDGKNENLYFNMRTFDSKMVHYHYNSFQIDLKDFVLNYRALATFETGSNGKITGLRFEVLGMSMPLKRKQD